MATSRAYDEGYKDGQADAIQRMAELKKRNMQLQGIAASRSDRIAELEGEVKERSAALSLALDSLEDAQELARKAEAERAGLREVQEACEALTYPDGVIRAPLLDGPELDELNQRLAALRGEEAK